tara:strand:- start:27140 stop:27826 length:687 start_codon:yes stop_codon:yes gene_type:complete
MSSDYSKSRVLSIDEKHKKTIARAILDADAFLIRADNPFTLTSGLFAPFYINCRQILSHPDARSTIASGLSSVIKPLNCDIIAGGVTAGVPYASLVADRLGLPLVYVRPEPKSHGTGSQIEGGDVTGRRLLLVEDLITTATSILKFVSALRSSGAEIHDVAVVFSRITESAKPKLQDANLSITALCDLDNLLQVALETGRATEGELISVRQFLEDPDGWSAEHKRYEK